MPLPISSLKSNLTNPARSYLFDVIIAGIGVDVATMQLRCMATGLPSRGNGRINIPFQGTAGFNVAGKITLDTTWNVTWKEGEDQAIFNAILGWQELIQGILSGAGSLDNAYKATGYARLLSAAGSGSVPYQSIQIDGMWPSLRPTINLKNDSDGTIDVECQFAFDTWEPQAFPAVLASGLPILNGAVFGA